MTKLADRVARLRERRPDLGPPKSIAGFPKNVPVGGGGDGGTTSGARGLSAGKPGYPVPQALKNAENPHMVDEGGEKKGKDLGFGFNEEGYPLQDRYEFQGLPISVENKKGSTRKWYDPHGKEKGSSKMHADYGYVEGATGSDGEPIDVYVGPDEEAEFAYVIHQNKAPDFEEYDEDKVMLGFSSEEDAKELYLKQYDDEGFYGGMSSMPIEKFKEKVSSGGKITNEVVARVMAALLEEKGHKGFFVGIKLPEELAQRIVVPDGEPVEKLHITLFYQKGWSPKERKLAASIVKKIAMKMLPVKAEVGDIGRFPASESSDGKDVVYAKVESPELHDFRETVMQAIERAGLDNPQTFENYEPHVTLAYVDPGSKPPVDDLEAEDVELEELVFGGLEQVDEAARGSVGKPAKVDGDDIAPHVGGKTVDQLMDDIMEDLQEPEPDGTAQRDPFDFCQGTLKETKAGTVTVTVGSFDPFHRGHGQLVRKLAQQASRVVVLVDEDGTYSYDVRVDVMRRSLPDVWSKLQVAMLSRGKGLTEGISEVVKGGKSSIQADTPLNVQVPADRYDEAREDVRRARMEKESGGDVMFDPDATLVKTIPGVRDSDTAGGVSGAQVRQALVQNDVGVLRKLMDPQLVSNEDDFGRVVQELSGKGVTEEIVERILLELGPSSSGGASNSGTAPGSGPGSVGLRAQSSAWSTGQGVWSGDEDEDGDEWRRKVTYGDKMQKTTHGTPDVVGDD